MMKTPDELLDVVRAELAADDPTSGAFAELDELLTSGGPLPTDWALTPAERATEDVPLPG